MELVSFVVESSDRIIKVVLLSHLGSCVTELAGLELTKLKAHVLTHLSLHLISIHSFHGEDLWVFVFCSLEHGFDVSVSVDNALIVLSGDLFVLFIVVISIVNGSADHIVVIDGERLISTGSFLYKVFGIITHWF